MKSRPEGLDLIREREVIDREGFDAWMAARGYSWHKLARGEYGFTIEQAQVAYVMADPVLFARAWMSEPDTGAPYEFWPYQQPSVRAWNQDVIHKDGAEVGKTREIIVLLIWGSITGMGFTRRNPSSLVGAPQQGHLDDIISAILLHFGEHDVFDGPKPFLNRFWRTPKKKPYYTMYFKGVANTKGAGVSEIHFRPSGYDGSAYRGVHVNGFLIKDEAAKDVEELTWSEFWRAGKPGCLKRLYSVPTGVRGTQYHRISQTAVVDLPEGSRGWRLFHWPKTLMPAPFWDEARRLEYLRVYHSENDPGYQRNVLGLDGEDENTVFPWAVLSRAIKDLPQYRTLRLTANAAENSLHVVVYRVGLIEKDNQKANAMHYLADRHEPLDRYQTQDDAARRSAFRALLSEFIQPVANALLWGGADLGFSNDPTEIIVSEEIGQVMRDIIRISAKGVDYPMQCELLFCLDELLGFNAQWGVDMGSAGTAVVQNLQTYQAYKAANYNDRLTGYNFAKVVDCMDEDGNPLTEKDSDGIEQQVTKPAKNFATEDVMLRRLYDGTWFMPYDQDRIDHYGGHTSREGQRHKIYSKENDHTIDADRVKFLRKVFGDYGVNVFSSGAHVR